KGDRLLTWVKENKSAVVFTQLSADGRYAIRVTVPPDAGKKVPMTAWVGKIVDLNKYGGIEQVDIVWPNGMTLWPQMFALGLNSDGSRMVAMDSDGNLLIWNPHNGEIANQIINSPERNHEWPLFVPGHSQLMAVRVGPGDGPTTLQVFDLHEQQPQYLGTLGRLAAEIGVNFRLVQTPNGILIAHKGGFELSAWQLSLSYSVIKP
ncbi:MAG: hypothetical protein WCG27_10190, partial [Pseudomonadota bacterium]